MRTQRRSLALSLLIHCSLAAIVIATQHWLETTTPPVVIDLSLSVSEALAGEPDKPLGSPVAAPLATPMAPSKPQAVHSQEQPRKQPQKRPVKIAHKPVHKQKKQTKAPRKKRQKPVPLVKPTKTPAPVRRIAATTTEATTSPAASTTAAATGAAQAAPSAMHGSPSTNHSNFAGGNRGKGSGSRYDFNAVRKKILRNLRFPSTARKLGLSGKIVVSFILKTDGHVEAINVVSSSGHAILDRAVVATIRRIAPFSKPPVKAQLMLPIVFHLRS